MNLGSRFFGNIIRQFLRVPSAQRLALAAVGGRVGWPLKREKPKARKMRENVARLEAAVPSVQCTRC